MTASGSGAVIWLQIQNFKLINCDRWLEDLFKKMCAQPEKVSFSKM